MLLCINVPHSFFRWANFPSLLPRLETRQKGIEQKQMFLIFSSKGKSVNYIKTTIIYKHICKKNHSFHVVSGWRTFELLLNQQKKKAAWAGFLFCEKKKVARRKKKSCGN
jgi:hypothetical protein